MRYNLRLKSIEQVDNTVTATFANEETLHGDLLIGCDGIHSTTRTFVVGKDTKPDFAGVSVILGLGTLTPEEEAAAGLVQGFNMWLGAGTMFGAVKCDPHGTWAW
jgi:2-polyprenyl-6-methoxyphenol hydroxylase-like FAD-dependent oxidoreductase